MAKNFNGSHFKRLKRLKRSPILVQGETFSQCLLRPKFQIAFYYHTSQPNLLLCTSAASHSLSAKSLQLPLMLLLLLLLVNLISIHAAAVVVGCDPAVAVVAVVLLL